MHSRGKSASRPELERWPPCTAFSKYGCGTDSILNATNLNDRLHFFQNCPELVTDDIVKRLCSPVEGALTLLSNSESILKGYQAELKALLAMLRLRLFQTLALLPSNALEGSYAQLLRLLVRTNRSSMIAQKQNKKTRIFLGCRVYPSRHSV